MHGCAEKRKKSFRRESECVKFSLLGIRDSHILTHIPSFQICFCPRASAAATLPPLQKKKVGAVGEECVFSLRVALHERFQTGNNHPRHKERALLSLLGGVARGELKDWNLVIGTNRQRKRTRCLRERSIFFFPRMNSTGMHLVLGHLSVQNLSPLLGGCTTPLP